MADMRMKSIFPRDRWASASKIQASRQASHSTGTICSLHAASGKGAIGGRDMTMRDGMTMTCGGKKIMLNLNLFWKGFRLL